MPRAPRVCGELNCAALVHDPSRRKCDLHYKPFGGKGGTSSRTTTSDHRRRRLRILGRAGYRCEIRYEGICLGAASEFDHVVPVGEGGSDTDMNGQAACVPCHRRKSAIEARRAQL
jgi:5-methylcytosine-specific restriction endonuclease McrA